MAGGGLICFFTSWLIGHPPTSVWLASFQNATYDFAIAPFTRWVEYINNGEYLVGVIITWMCFILLFLVLLPLFGLSYFYIFQSYIQMCDSFGYMMFLSAFVFSIVWLISNAFALGMKILSYILWGIAVPGGWIFRICTGTETEEEGGGDDLFYAT